MPNFNEVAVKQQTIHSREVAEMCEIRHDNLVAKIRGYEEIISNEDSSKLRSQEFFIPSTYTNSQNKEQPCYLLTKKGCDMVANKMTGSKGIIFTAKYVTRFEEMEQALKRQQPILDYNAELLEFDKVAKVIGLTKNDKLLSVLSIMKRHNVPTLGLEELATYKIPKEFDKRDCDKEALEYAATHNPVGFPLREYYKNYVVHCATNGIRPLEKNPFCKVVRQLGYEAKSRRVDGESCKVWL